MRKSLFRLLPFMSAMLITACGEKPIPEPVEPVDPGTPVSGPVDYSYDLMPSTLKTLDGGWKPGENKI